ncbi:MAG TPA: ABC transporter substrate-binding protein [Terrimicrobiaceae bacterium]
MAIASPVYRGSGKPPTPTSLMKFLKRIFPKLLAGVAAFLLAITVQAEPLKIGYSDWPGFTILEVAKQKGWFKDAGLDVDLVWFDYLPSLDAFAAGKVDAVTVVATDALVNGANGAKSKIIAILDYSDGSDMIIGKAGVDSIKDLKGQKVGIEVSLVEHLLLLEALKQNGMTQSDVEIVNTATNETPQTLASGKVAAVGAWYPVSSQALKQVPGSKKLFTSADAKGLIYDVLAVNPVSFAQRKEDWAKIVQIFYKSVDYMSDPATREDAIKIMAAKAGADPDEYAKNVPGTHFLSLAEAKKTFQKGEGLDSIYGSMTIGNQFNLENKVYKQSQKPSSYLAPSIVEGL